MKRLAIFAFVVVAATASLVAQAGQAQQTPPPATGSGQAPAAQAQRPPQAAAGS